MTAHKDMGKHPEKGAPITKKEQVHHNPDHKIDQDYPGFPHGQSKPSLINPKTGSDKETADLGKKDGDKINDTEGKEDGDDEQRSDGSGGAFASTEEVSEEYDMFDYELRSLK